MTTLALQQRQLFGYGFFGLPLAFVALPLYVMLPNHYARELGVPLAALGAVLLATRALDALVDPWIGRWTDRLHARSPRLVLRAAAAGAVLLGLGFLAVVLPPVRSSDALLAWAALTLCLTYFGYSLASVAHQSWGARLGGDEVQRSRITGTREAFALAGVLVAAAAPTLVGLAGTAALLAALLAAGWWAWRASPMPAAGAHDAHVGLAHPWRQPRFRRLLAVFVVNGTASAVPATLVLFFVQDLLQAPPGREALFLAVYFLAGAASVPAWLAAVRRFGLARSWLGGMLLAIATFLFALALGPGDEAAFIAVCAASGAALGADLALPSALLAGVVRDAGDGGRHEGGYFGWWNLAAKLNLALAAGLALPALQWAGYSPGRQDAQGLWALSIAYCLLPCILKTVAAAMLWRTFARGHQA